MHSKVTKFARGFTLLEVLVVIGLFAVAAGLVLSIGSHSHSGFNAEDDIDLVLATLQKARSQSMNGVCIGIGCVGAVAHGVQVDPHALVLFQGSTYDAADTANEYIQTESAATNLSGNTIIFMPLSGQTNATSTITIFDNHSIAAVVLIGQDGQLALSQ